MKLQMASLPLNPPGTGSIRRFKDCIFGEQVYPSLNILAHEWQKLGKDLSSRSRSIFGAGCIDSPGSIYPKCNEFQRSTSFRFLQRFIRFLRMFGKYRIELLCNKITEAMAGKLYPTDLSDQQWHILKPLIPTSKAGGLRIVNIREVVNAIFYILLVVLGA